MTLVLLSRLMDRPLSNAYFVLKVIVPWWILDSLPARSHPPVIVGLGKIRINVFNVTSVIITPQVTHVQNQIN